MDLQTQKPLHRLLLITLLFVGCKATQPAPPPAPETAPGGTILTIIFKVDPKLDTLTIFDIIRGPGRLRTEYPATTEAGPEELLFTFLDANGRTLRQTTQPYPAPNRYETPGEDGQIEAVELPEEARSIVLKTQASQRLRWLTITGKLPNGTALNQRIDLRSGN